MVLHRKVVKIIFAVELIILYEGMAPVCGQWKFPETLSSVEPVMITGLHLSTVDIIGFNLVQAGQTLISGKTAARSVVIDRKKDISVLVWYRVNDIYQNNQKLSLIFRCDSGDYLQDFDLRLQENTETWQQIGGAFVVEKRARLPAYYPSGTYTLHIETNSGSHEKIPGTFTLTPSRVVGTDELQRGHVEIPFQEFEYGLGKGRRNKRLPTYGLAIQLLWTGEFCTGYVTARVPVNVTFSVVAMSAGAGRGDPTFSFTLDGEVVKSTRVSGRKWKKYRIPVRIDSGEHKFGVRFNNGGYWRMLVIQKILIEKDGY